MKRLESPGGEGGEDKVVCLACRLSCHILMIVGTQAASRWEQLR